jgi:hypothetical protein
MADDLLHHLVEIGLPWLWEQRNLHIAHSRRFSAEERLVLQDYYDHRTLGTVRLATVDRISNPSFYHELKASGNPTLDISGAAGIAFIDCVVVRKTFQQGLASWNSILFHELVHIVQFDILGPRRHLELYLLGWMENGYRYHSIPFETQARRLEARFNRHEPPFSVREIVERELASMM